ncbi:Hypothetical predicted protein [Pelobates cultripes]|uniref:Uncharacterized protein n=1 Tax=Pelobates cultripes TaxID=61616 RepID=A0AAD1R7P8_PELCU|nr:Hypothetical predicted protein [Pelobates cultripes]
MPQSLHSGPAEHRGRSSVPHYGRQPPSLGRKRCRHRAVYNNTCTEDGGVEAEGERGKNEIPRARLFRRQRYLTHSTGPPGLKATEEINLEHRPHALSIRCRRRQSPSGFTVVPPQGKNPTSQGSNQVHGHEV